METEKRTRGRPKIQDPRQCIQVLIKTSVIKAHGDKSNLAKKIQTLIENEQL